MYILCVLCVCVCVYVCVCVCVCVCVYVCACVVWCECVCGKVVTSPPFQFMTFFLSFWQLHKFHNYPSFNKFHNYLDINDFVHNNYQINVMIQSRQLISLQQPFKISVHFQSLVRKLYNVDNFFPRKQSYFEVVLSRAT